MVKVVVKHSKATYDVDIDVSKNVQHLKQTLESLTGIPAARQTLMAKGAWSGTLKDDKDLSTVTLKEGQTVTLMGTATKLPDKPKEVGDLVHFTTSWQYSPHHAKQTTINTRMISSSIEYIS
jgi:hypothetical protein